VNLHLCQLFNNIWGSLPVRSFSRMITENPAAKRFLFIIIIIIIIEWLVRCWTLPSLRACSWLDDSALDDRRLPDQCLVVLEWIQRSGARCDAVGPNGGSSPLAKRPHRPYKGSTVVRRWIGTCNMTEELNAGGTVDVCEWWLISTSADLFIRKAGHPGNA